jgi:hypothetical protein
MATPKRFGDNSCRPGKWHDRNKREVKECLRAAKARFLDALDGAITAALATIIPENAAAWFRHCGYQIQLL